MSEERKITRDQLNSMAKALFAAGFGLGSFIVGFVWFVSWAAK